VNRTWNPRFLIRLHGTNFHLTPDGTWKLSTWDAALYATAVDAHRAWSLWCVDRDDFAHQMIEVVPVELATGRSVARYRYEPIESEARA
jgi:hypothetical protein